MRLLSSVRTFLSYVFHRRDIESDMDEEFRSHLASRAEDLQRQGLSRAEAERQARIEFGGYERYKEECREALGTRLLQEFAQDLRYGLRQLRRNPGFTIVAILTLALGIGANVAVFSLLDAVLLRPLPYSHPEHLFRLFRTEAKSGRAMVSTSYPDFEDWREQSHAFEAMAAYSERGFDLTGAGEPELLAGLGSTPGLLALLGVHPMLGRAFSRDDGPYVALLSYGLWQRQFARNAEVVGKPIYLDGRPYTVLGVLPPHFYFPPRRWGEPPQLLVPVVPNPQRGWHYVRVVGRLAPNVTEQQAEAEMEGIAARLAQAYPKTDRDQGIAIVGLREVAVSSARETAWVLFGAVFFLLLIACANVASLLLAQGAVREREITIRNMVGATRFRIMRQLLTEGFLLAGFGGAIGVGLAYWLFPLMTYAVPVHTAFFTRVHDAGIHLNVSVLVFSGLVLALSVIMFGLLPAWRTTRPVQTPRASLHAHGMRSALIAIEVALSLILLAGAGLMMRSLLLLQEVPVGFRPRGLLTIHVSLAGKKYSSPDQQAAFFGHVLQRLASLPSVASVGATTDLPMSGSTTRNGFEIPGAHTRQSSADYHEVSPGYFRTMGISLLSGRELLDSDSAHSPLVGVINQSMAREYWPNQSPIGASIVVVRAFLVSTPKGNTFQFKQRQMEIVGVVGDVLQLGLDAPPVPELFMPYAQWPSDEMSLVVRGRGSPSSMIPFVKKEIWSVDPEQPVTDIEPMDQWLAANAATRRFVLQLIGAFALIAVVLAAVGIYGVVSYWMRRRTHEIGIRMALGARRTDVLKMVLGQGLKLALIGVVIGIAGALALTRFLSSLLYGVKPTDPLTFIAGSLILIAVALVACYIPARRAAKVDPMVALRYE